MQYCGAVFRGAPSPGARDLPTGNARLQRHCAQQAVLATSRIGVSPPIHSAIWCLGIGPACRADANARPLNARIAGLDVASDVACAARVVVPPDVEALAIATHLAWPATLEGIRTPRPTIAGEARLPGRTGLATRTTILRVRARVHTPAGALSRSTGTLALARGAQETLRVVALEAALATVRVVGRKVDQFAVAVGHSPPPAGRGAAIVEVVAPARSHNEKPGLCDRCSHRHLPTVAGCLIIRRIPSERGQLRPACMASLADGWRWVAGRRPGYRFS